jgi:hypothetical protein
MLLKCDNIPKFHGYQGAEILAAKHEKFEGARKIRGRIFARFIKKGLTFWGVASHEII